MGGPGSGPRKGQSAQLRERLEELEGELPGIIDSLVEVAQGAPIVCPYCEKTLPQRKVDVEAAKYLVDRILGKPSSKLEVTIEERIVLTADQCARILLRGEEARAEFEELPAPGTALMLVEAEAQGAAE